MAAAIQKLHDDFLSCNICTELYQDPCTLACGHTFCRSCLSTFTKTQPDAIKAKSLLCPNCRQITKVSNPERSVVVAVESEMDMYDKYQMCQSGNITTVSGTATLLQEAPSTGRIMLVKERPLDSSFSLGKHRVLEEIFNPECKPTLLDTIDIRMESDKITPNPRDVVVVDVNGIETLVVTDSNNKCLKSFFYRNNKLCQSSLLLSSDPWSVARLTDSMVIVTFFWYNEILIVQVTPDLILLSTITTQKKCRGIASLNGSTFVASCYSYDPTSLDILDVKGHVQKSVKIEKNLIKYPNFLSTMSNGYILVSDEGYCSVCCLSVDDFTYSPSGERALSIPRGITTSKTGDILVADRDNNKVIQLTASGEFVRDLLTSQDKCVHPYGIYLHHDKLYVGLVDGTVNVYKC